MTDHDGEIPLPSDDEPETPPRRTRAELDAMIETLWDHVQDHQAQLALLRAKLKKLDDTNTSDKIARWLPFPPPPAAEDPDHTDQTPLFTIAQFVAYYNSVYVGTPGTRAMPIPDCWLEHPALIAELATLTYTWREAHLGKHATPRDAQYWHDRWRAGFVDRLTAWVHPHCLTNTHKPTGAPARPDRYTHANHHPETPEGTDDATQR